ncbi:hypothetical protein ACQKQA_18740 [Pseudomonas sp. NPDC089530]|uniref:hypothetical protein n=1 Tax=Pseudomonas sp. NPDC089530 TaxID=3390651 RepID=UPI003D076CC2
MRLIQSLFRTGVVLCLAGLVGLQAVAGPSFNTDRQALDKLSASAGTELQRGFQNFHEMLMFLEQKDVTHATEAKAAALQHFNESVALFKRVSEKASEQKIAYQPKDDSEKEIVGAFQNRLKELGIPEPATEKQLASLAVTAVTKHIHVLERSSFKGTQADYPTLRKVLRSEAQLLDLGILTSMVWTLSAAPPGGAG